MIWQSLLLGLTQGIVCSGICLPVLGTYLIGEKRTFKESLKLTALFLSGRFLGYIVIAIFSAAAGKAFMHKEASAYLFPLAYMIVGFLMVVTGLSGTLTHYPVCRKVKRVYTSRSYIGMAGLLTGLNLCPPFIGMMLISAESGKFTESIMAFTVFFAATSLYLLPVVFAGMISSFAVMRKASYIVSVAAGLIFIFKSVRILYYSRFFEMHL